MAEKYANTTAEDVRSSVSNIYSDLLSRRRAERAEKEERKEEEREAKRAAKKEKEIDPETGKPKSKKDKREQEYDAWKEVVVGLTGDDLEYVQPKKNKKKYKKWLGEDGDMAPLITKPVKKKKKRNYQKEFDPELNMLKNILNGQNKFTDDLAKRFATMAGPNTKDAMPLNKTMVEFAAVLNASRANSLGVLREIGSVKKTIADLYMKQKKLEHDLGSGNTGFNETDLGLMGSSIANQMFNMGGSQYNPMAESPVSLGETGVVTPTAYTGDGSSPVAVAQPFDPKSWNPSGLGTGTVSAETIPHTIIAELHRKNGSDQGVRWKAIRNDNGEELVGVHIPTLPELPPKSFNEADMTAKGEFDQVYKLQIVNND